MRHVEKGTKPFASTASAMAAHCSLVRSTPVSCARSVGRSRNPRHGLQVGYHAVEVEPMVALS